MTDPPLIPKVQNVRSDAASSLTSCSIPAAVNSTRFKFVGSRLSSPRPTLWRSAGSSWRTGPMDRATAPRPSQPRPIGRSADVACRAVVLCCGVVSHRGGAVRAQPARFAAVRWPSASRPCRVAAVPRRHATYCIYGRYKGCGNYRSTNCHFDYSGAGGGGVSQTTAVGFARVFLRAHTRLALCKPKCWH